MNPELVLEVEAAAKAMEGRHDHREGSLCDICFEWNTIALPANIMALITEMRRRDVDARVATEAQAAIEHKYVACQAENARLREALEAIVRGTAPVSGGFREKRGYYAAQNLARAALGGAE